MESAELAVLGAVPFIHGIIPEPGEGGLEGFLLPPALGQQIPFPAVTAVVPEEAIPAEGRDQAGLTCWICQCQLQKPTTNQDCSFPGQLPAWKGAQGSFFPQDFKEATQS